uniref:Heat shock factor binding protein n=2 Tax=Solanum TaxID=4107 RepID=M1C3D5_SOLTU
MEDGQDADNTKQSTADMTVFVQNLLQQMQTSFETRGSREIIFYFSSNFLITFQVSMTSGTPYTSTRFDYISSDDMGNRIDELEQSINDLRIEMGQEGSSSPSAAVKSKDDTKSADDSA